MTRYGVTEHGFRRKLFSEILRDKRALAKETLGEDIDLSNTSFLGLLIENQSEAEATLWEKMEDVYLSAFVGYATGQSLDAGGEYITLSRRPATQSKGFVTIDGDNGVEVDIGFRVTTSKGDVIFITTEKSTIVDGSAEVPVISVAAGETTNVSEMAINKIVNPMMGVSKVYNTRATEGGLDIETDAEFRLRYQLSTSKGGGSTTDAIRAALLDMDNVVDAFVKENVSMEELDGLPPKTIACYVFGSDDEEVARTILDYKSGGIQAFGETYVSLEDEQGEVHQIGFTRPNEVGVYVKISISPGEGIKNTETYTRAVLNYIGGEDEEGIRYKGLKLGEDVVISRIMSAVTCLGGVADIEVKIGTSPGSYQGNNIKVSTNQIARVAKVVIDYDL